MRSAVFTHMQVTICILTCAVHAPHPDMGTIQSSPGHAQFTQFSPRHAQSKPCILTCAVQFSPGHAQFIPCTLISAVHALHPDMRSICTAALALCSFLFSPGHAQSTTCTLTCAVQSSRTCAVSNRMLNAQYSALTRTCAVHTLHLDMRGSLTSSPRPDMRTVQPPGNPPSHLSHPSWKLPHSVLTCPHPSSELFALLFHHRLGWSESTKEKALALHAADPSSILSIP